MPGYLPTLPTTQNPYIAYYPVKIPDPDPDPPFLWHQNQSSYSLPVLPRTPGNSQPPTFPRAHRHSVPGAVPTLSLGFSSWQDPYLDEPQRSVPANRRIEHSGGSQPYALSVQQEASEGDERAVVAISPNLRPPMAHTQTYPSPHSDVSKEETRSSCFSILPSNDVSPSMMFAPSPSIASHRSHPGAGEKSDEPPRNISGQITCIHPKCADDQPVFSRKCEWT